MVQSLGRVVIAAAALNVVATLARPTFQGHDLEARDLEGQDISTYNRRHFDVDAVELEAREFDDFELDARELDDLELDARELEDIELDARELGEFEVDARGFDDIESLEAREPEPLHIPFFSNWNAGRKQRNKDLQRGKKERLEADQAAGIDATRRDLSDSLETREPEPKIPLFTNWNAGRKQRKADRKKGKQDRLAAEKGATGGEQSTGEATRRDLSEDLETREPKIPFFTNWNAGRKQRNADRKKGKQDRLAADQAAGIDATRRDISDSLETREPEPKIPFFTNWNAGRKQRNADRKKGKQDRLAAEKGTTGGDQSTGEATRRELDFSDEFEARDYDDVEFEARDYMLDELD